MYENMLDSLRQAYDNHARERDAAGLEGWKIAERQEFMNLLRAEGKRTLLEIGAGPGHFGAYFRDQGFDVTCTDLSPQMVALCRAKGLRACEMDFLHLDFPPASFDAVFALNCLLHVPSANLAQVLAVVHRLLRPDGLFFYGVYGGYSFEGVWPDDHHEPKRYFVFYTDDELRDRAAVLFDEVSFRAIPIEGDNESHFQSLILRPKELA
ncbi:MAG: class I SAM-dependent methyltransferase [Anaerolineae bacterium]|nr:MAG: class I SAM-dependent methyltransferase [Anaerolineae bacterium]